MSILDKKALTFLENYLNNAAPTGHESRGQKYGWNISSLMWMNSLRMSMAQL